METVSWETQCPSRWFPGKTLTKFLPEQLSSFFLNALIWPWPNTQSLAKKNLLVPHSPWSHLSLPSYQSRLPAKAPESPLAFSGKGQVLVHSVLSTPWVPMTRTLCSFQNPLVCKVRGKVPPWESKRPHRSNNFFQRILSLLTLTSTLLHAKKDVGWGFTDLGFSDPSLQTGHQWSNTITTIPLGMTCYQPHTFLFLGPQSQLKHQESYITIPLQLTGLAL